MPKAIIGKLIFFLKDTFFSILTPASPREKKCGHPCYRGLNPTLVFFSGNPDILL